jgi:lipopolysaccharide biosynthesis glycosyltransferase
MTSESFKDKINEELKEYNLPIYFYIQDLNTLFEAGCARLHIFYYKNIRMYNKILYLDADILINNDINTIFDLNIDNDKLYALEEGIINHPNWGDQFFDFNEIDPNTVAFTSGILLFNNNNEIKSLFKDIIKHIDTYIYIENNPIPYCLDQPFIIYNAVIQNKYNNKLLNLYAENNPEVISNKVIYHFPGGPGLYSSKYEKMNHFNNVIRESRIIKKVFFQTSKDPLDDYVITMIKSKLDDNWDYQHFDDFKIIQYFNDNPNPELPNIIDKFNSFSLGAHKADLFRYYFLYLNGGFYMDSDAMIYQNINKIVKDYSFISVNSSCHPNTIFQGILGANPFNPIIRKALLNIYNTDNSILENNYHYFCGELYKIIHNEIYDFKIMLYTELRTDNKGDKILDNNKNIIFKHYWYNRIIPRRYPDDIYDELTHEFKRIYDTNFWITGSGSGSTVDNTKLYNNCIIKFIERNKISNVTDLGCGDWQSTHLIYDNIPNIDYLGIDCVENIIEENIKKFPIYNFMTLNILNNIQIVRDSDLYIIKDVLQHLKLYDIYFLLDNLIKKKFKYIIISNNGNQNYDNLELYDYMGIGRGLHSNYLPLKKYNPITLLDYEADEYKHVCIIKSE